MKRIFALLIAAALMPAMVVAQADYKQMMNGVSPFYTQEQAPHLENVLPNPPGITDPRFADDWNQYVWGKSVRETPRGERAVQDAFLNAAYFMKVFSPVMSHPVTPEANPELFMLLCKAHKTEQEAGASAKAYFKRVRPYQQFHEPTSVPKGENPTDFTSYPSGHTHVSWLVGMILTTLDPEHTVGIMKVAYELGQSRVITGFHYQSDVDAGRVAGSITFARLCAMPEFLEMLQAAKNEYQSGK